MKKFFILSLFCFFLLSCGKDNTVVIYSSMEDYRNEDLRQMLKKDFKDINVEIQYFPSGTNASKLKAEKLNSKADIIMDLDYANLNIVSEYLEDLSSYDYTNYVEDAVPNITKFMPSLRSTLGIIVNTEKLELLGLKVPKSFDDLINPVYINQIVMPSPKASGTGYGFLLALYNLYGEEDCFKYFDEFQKNVKQFTSSGSGPVNMVVRGEAAIGLGLISQAVLEINKGANIDIIEMKEGTPFSLVGQAVIKDRLQKENVKIIFDYLINNWTRYDLKHYFPDTIFKDQESSNVENFPQGLNYMNMSGFTSLELKEKLLKLWKY